MNQLVDGIRDVGDVTRTPKYEDLSLALQVETAEDMQFVYVGNTGFFAYVSTDGQSHIDYNPDDTFDRAESHEKRVQYAVTFLGAMSVFVDWWDKLEPTDNFIGREVGSYTNQYFANFLIRQFGDELVKVITEAQSGHLYYRLSVGDLVQRPLLLDYLSEMRGIVEANDYKVIPPFSI